MSVEIEEVASHRNGIAGAPFYAVTFRDGRLNLVAAVFSEPGHVAVLDRDLVARGVIEFGINSWRGDVYEGALRAAIAAWEAARS